MCGLNTVILKSTVCTRELQIYPVVEFSQEGPLVSEDEPMLEKQPSFNKIQQDSQDTKFSDNLKLTFYFSCHFSLIFCNSSSYWLEIKINFFSSGKIDGIPVECRLVERSTINFKK